MPTREEVAYFGAGPAPMRTDVLTEAAKAFLNYKDSGMGLVEISHRSGDANKVMADFTAHITELLAIPDNYEVLLCHGGGTGGFASTVYNLVAVWVEARRRRAETELGADKEDEIVERVKTEVHRELKVDYLVTGSWSLKASQEAANILEPLGKGHVNVALDARTANGGKFGRIPAESEWSLTPTPKEGGPGSALVYYCDNETVDGVEFPELPARLGADGADSERLVVADMSSNFLSRAVDVRKYSVIFGGAQKNIGITDLTIVIVRKDILAAQAAPAFLHTVGVWSPPSIMHWPTLAKNNSLYNTLPIFSVYLADLVIQTSLREKGPLSSGKQAAESELKAKLIYDVLGAHPDKFTVCADNSVRSRMNICFRIRDEATEKAFLKGADDRKLLGMKGHRSVQGIRISNYNAVSVKSVELVKEYLEAFLKTL